MFTEEEFKDRFSRAPLGELIAMLEEPGKYQLLALKAAKAELESRTYTPEEQEEALQAWKQKGFQQPKVIPGPAKSVIDTARSTLESIRPDTAETISTARTIRVILIIYLLVFIYNLYQLLFSGILTLPELFNGTVFGTYMLVLILLFPAALCFFYLRKKVGWFLLYYLAVSAVVEALYNFISYQRLEPIIQELIRRPDGTPSEMILLLRLLLFGGTAYVLSKPDIRNIYAVGKSAVFIITWVYFLISLFILALISY